METKALDNIWEDAKRMSSMLRYVHGGISISIGVIGAITIGIPGSGIIGGGYYTGSRFKDILHFDPSDLSKRVANMFTPNYMVNIRDFRNNIEL